MSLFRKQNVPVDDVTRKCFTIAVGMFRSGKSLADVQQFLAQHIAVTTQLSSHDAADLVNRVVETLAENIQKAGVL